MSENLYGREKKKACHAGSRASRFETRKPLEDAKGRLYIRSPYDMRRAKNMTNIS